MAKRLNIKRLDKLHTPKQRERMDLKRLVLKPLESVKPLEKQRSPKPRERLKLERKTNVKRK